MKHPQSNYRLSETPPLPWASPFILCENGEQSRSDSVPSTSHRTVKTNVRKSKHVLGWVAGADSCTSQRSAFVTDRLGLRTRCSDWRAGVPIGKRTYTPIDACSVAEDS